MIDVPNWSIAIIAIIGAPFGAYVGVRVAVAELRVKVSSLQTTVDKILDQIRSLQTEAAQLPIQIIALQDEVKLMRQRQHDIAGFITRHELEIETLKRKAG